MDDARRPRALVPGDSPAGLRLPLASLPHLDEADRPVVAPRDPFAPLAAAAGADPYAPPQQFVSGAAHDHARCAKQFVEQGIAIDGSVRTAISVEPRDGRLCVFMPPTESAADYLELLVGGRADAPPNSPRRFTSKAIRRRTIRASTSSRSRPIPA